MFRVATLFAIALSSAACMIDTRGDTPSLYEIDVNWTTTNPPAGAGAVNVSYGGSKEEVLGYNGTLHVVGDTYEERDVQICAALARRYTQIVDGHEVPVYEPLEQQCKRVSVFASAVAFKF